MPINLSDLKNSVAKNQAPTPKWFDPKLTGKGGKSGIIHAELEPSVFQSGTTAIENYMRRRHSSWQNGVVRQTCVPLRPMSVWERSRCGLKFREKEPDTYILGTDAQGRELSIHAELSSCLITERDSGKSLDITYDAYLYVTSDRSSAWHACYTKMPRIQDTAGQNLYMPIQTLCLMATLEKLINTPWDRQNPAEILKNIFQVPDDAITGYLETLKLYDMFLDCVALWTEGIGKETDTLIHQVKMLSPAEQAMGWRAAGLFAGNLEQYKVPLNEYRKAYASLKAAAPEDILKAACRQNLNLLLSSTMDGLEAAKPELSLIPKNPSHPQCYKHFSISQSGAIYSEKPLILVQAGAGSGKSSVILGRMEYMRSIGIPMEKVLVLSFTNAAANHILEKEPSVRSSTIASLVHSIYQENWNHSLSNLDTLINSLEIWFDRSTNYLVDAFSDCLRDLRDASRTDCFTRASNFIEENLGGVMEILDRIGQTTLELEIIICYLAIRDIKEPDDIQPEYVIIDEVQDTSIFEFVFLLNYVLKHRAGLFMVGDCSQTLYEFRASNPKALNMLEASGVFEAHALQTNYRSNQEILDFANVALSDIEANQFANIRLRANDIACPPDKSTFVDRVKLTYHQINKQKELLENIPCDLGSKPIREWIQSCLDAGGKVAVLTYSRREVEKAKEAVKTLWPDKKQSSLVPKKQFNSTVFSKYIRTKWDMTRFMPAADFLTHLERDIMNNLPSLTYMSPGTMNETAKAISEMFKAFRKAHGLTIANASVLEASGKMSKAAFLDLVKKCMLDFEIQNNSIRQSLTSKGNEEDKNDMSGDFIFSTIHSAKGLEFENVLVIHKNRNEMPEDMKRMYYVAFTRATSREYVLSYDTTGLPSIAYGYLGVVENLPGDLTPEQEAALPIGDEMLKKAAKDAAKTA